jgi:putative FmdB family regulatory protein
MPTYEFRCPKGHEFEKFYRSIGAAPSVVACPTCGAIAERQMSAGGGLVFKGSGFYITDYGKDGKKAQTAPSASGEGSTAGGGEAAAPKGEPKIGGDAKPSVEKKAEPKTAEPKPSASKTAAKKSSGRAKSSE